MKHVLLFLAVMLLTGCSKDSEVTAQTMTQKLYITIDGKTLPVQLVDNVATQTLVAALQEGDITYEAHDYGGHNTGWRRHPLQRQPDRALLWIKLMELHPSGAYGVFVASGIGVFPQSRARECHGEALFVIGRNGYQRHPKQRY